jgi:glucose dehydrogenase
MEQTTTLPAVAVPGGDSQAADRRYVERRGVLAGRLVGGVIAAIGAVLAGGGLWLVLLGGSPYYALSGLGYVMSGVQLWRRRPAGAGLAVALLGATVCWGVWEAGLNYWALFPRVFVPAGLGLLALLATLRFPANNLRRVAAVASAVLCMQDRRLRDGLRAAETE